MVNSPIAESLELALDCIRESFELSVEVPRNDVRRGTKFTEEYKIDIIVEFELDGGVFLFKSFELDQ